MSLEKMDIKNYILDYIRYKQFNWYVHVQTMNEERLPPKILEWRRMNVEEK